MNKLGTMGLILQRLRGAQAAGAAVDRLRRGDDLVRAVRAGGRLATPRRCGPAPGRRRRLGAQRHQVLDHQRRQVHLVHGDGGDRPGQGRQRHLRVRGAQGRPGLRRSARRSASWASRARRPPSCTSRTAASPATASSASPAPGSRPRWRPSTTPARRSARRRSASPRARSTPRSPTPRSASSSASRSPTSRACSSCSPTWR